MADFSVYTALELDADMCDMPSENIYIITIIY